MDVLPPELIRCILEECVRLCRFEKNFLLPLRLVCKSFDAVLKEHVCKTVQIEVSRLIRGDAPPDMSIVSRFGHLSHAMFLDMMAVRDQEEVDRLNEVFEPIFNDLPDMKILLDHLSNFCMTDGKWDETNFRDVLDGVLQNTPNMVSLKINLPFQVIGRSNQTATLLLANAFHCLAKRGGNDDFTRLETLTVDHITDITTLSLCRNPIDLQNSLFVFKELKNLVITIKVQESTNHRTFGRNLWLLITEARNLESLCIIGWSTKRSSRRRSRNMTNALNWASKSLPYHMKAGRVLSHLRFLELKRVDIEAPVLLQLVEDNSASLKELYLIETHLKVVGGQIANTPLWIGRGSPAVKSPEAIWIAESLRDMESLKLDVLRVTDLGYDNYDADRTNTDSFFDLHDPMGLERSFDERFVGTFLGIEPDPQSPQKASFITAMMASAKSTFSLPSIINPALLTFSPDDMEWTSQLDTARRLEEREYDAEIFQLTHNTTSHWKRSIDNTFHNHNQKALTELQKIIEVADKGMDLLTAQSVPRS